MKNIFKHLKVAVLDNNIIRFEYSPKDNFSDQESLFIANKKAIEKEIKFEGWRDIQFSLSGYTFKFKEKDPLNTLVVTKKNNVVYKYKEIKNSGELPMPNKTPEIFALMDSPRVLIPSQGYDKNGEKFIIQNDAKDLYLLLCQKDHKLLRKQFIQLTGNNELPRIKSFGLYASRYYKYNYEYVTKLIQKYEAHKIPLDNIVLSETIKDENDQYKIDKKLFPNIETFFMYARRHNVQTILADQPHPIDNENTLISKDEIGVRQAGLTSILNKGLDGWWINEKSAKDFKKIHANISNSAINNFAYDDVAKQFFTGFVLDPAVRERNLLLKNSQKITDSRSHKTGILRGILTAEDEQGLRNEILAQNHAVLNMNAYYASDLGGNEKAPTKNQYIRWMQYGAFSPIMKPYCGFDAKKPLDIWKYGDFTENLCKTYINMRYRLLNVFYTAAYKNIETGLGVCTPLCMHYPDDKKVYKEETSYILGNSILVSPVTSTEKPKQLKKKDFGNKLWVTIYPNEEFKGPKAYTRIVRSLTDVNSFYNEIKKENPEVNRFSFRFRGEILLKHDTKLALKHETGVRVLLNGKEIHNSMENHCKTFTELGKITKNKKYKIVVETIQRRRIQLVDLCEYRVFANKKNKIYLPEGEWFNIYHRNVYQGRRYIKEKFKIDEIPLFVKAGSLLAMYKKVDNISKMSLKQVVYDYYTSKRENINDYFYEDDGKTMGYTIGEYRKNEYHTYFDRDRYVIVLKGNEKVLDDEVKIRDAFFKVHVRDAETIKEVLINGNPIRFKRHDHKKKAIPFLDNEFARDSKTLTFKFKQIIKDDYKIELVVGEN